MDDDSELMAVSFTVDVAERTLSGPDWQQISTEDLGEPVGRSVVLDRGSGFVARDLGSELPKPVCAAALVGLLPRPRTDPAAWLHGPAEHPARRHRPFTATDKISLPQCLAPAS
ncbi:hypothetical protein [Actinoplanes sp. NPDC051859]|uniref:hypothetical protein n=1 Tax=Actinoplanes sp. NPDC051859 TaxID=3363909 RepID=UPI003788D7A4